MRYFGIFDGYFRQVQVDASGFWERQQGMLDDAAARLEAARAEEEQRAVSEVRPGPAIDKHSAALAAGVVPSNQSVHADQLLAWGKQADERRERRRAELAEKVPPPSPGECNNIRLGL